MDNNCRLLLTVLLFLSSAIGVMAYDFKIDGIYYQIDEDGNAIVTYQEYVEGVGGTSDYSGDIVIPHSVWDGSETRYVTKIGDDAFRGSAITSISMSSNIWFVGNSAFQDCTSLRNVSLSGTISMLGDFVFNGCTSLQRLFIPANVEYIGSQPFNNTGIKTLILEDGNKELDFKNKYTFSVDTLYLGREKFFGDRNPYNRDHTHMHLGAREHLIIGDSVTEISCSEFYHCSMTGKPPKNITIGKNFKGFYNGAFRSAQIPTDTFNIYISDVELWCKMAQGNLRQRNKRLYLNNELIDTLIIPGTVKDLVTDFQACTNIKAAVLEEGIKSIGDWTFSGCRNLQYLYVPSSVGTIVADAFNYCDQLNSIVVSEDSPYFSSIGTTLYNKEKTRIFFDPGEPAAVSIPASVTEIDDFAFRGCQSLTTIYCHNATPCTIYEKSFTEALYETGVLYVPQGSIEAYKTADIWQNFVNIEEFDVAGIDHIGESNRDVTIQATDDGIVIGNYCGMVSVYHPNGTLHSRTESHGARTMIPLSKGTYIIRTGEKTSKITH